MTREHTRLMLVRKQLVALEQAQASRACAVPEQTVERRDQLERLKALGPALSTTMSYEVFYEDFLNRRQVASYVGLTPSPWQSGASRAPARQAARAPASTRSSSPGSGCDIRPTASSAAGSAPAPPMQALEPSALPSSHWPAS